MKAPQTSLKNWGDQKWRTKSGKPSSKTGERYLPEAAIKSLSSAEYAATTRAKRAGKKIPENPLWARNWAAWGDGSPRELGAVLVFARDGGGHVGIYVGEDTEYFHVLGGNQKDQVCIVRIRKPRLIGCRAMYSVGKPQNVRPIYLHPEGIVSANER